MQRMKECEAIQGMADTGQGLPAIRVAETNCGCVRLQAMPSTRKSEADAVTGVTTAGFTRSSNFDDLTTSEAIITRHWVRQLDTGKLGLL